MPQSEPAIEPLKAVVKPWYDSLSDPARAQENVLKNLLEDYSKTEYGKTHNATPSLTIDEYRRRFKPIDYNSLKPIIDRVSKGDFQALLPEPTVAWVMTRGTTGVPKILPITRKHLTQVLYCGARALANYVLRTRKFEILYGKVLNLNFPSRIGAIQSGNGLATYGHSSGTYAKMNPSFAGVDLIPRQEEIDALGGGLTKKDWEARFELTYELTKDEEVRVCMGVAPVIVSFAKHVKHHHGKLPKEFWRIGGIFCTSVPKIQWKYAPILRYFYGDAPVIEMYTATEGVFAQQLDDLPYISPNYDAYFFEVINGKRVKMLYEMKRGEWGRLLVSSCLFPRYDIEDMIECLGRNYFRVFGRARRSTVLAHIFYRAFTQWFI
ncbi:MAG: GH3 auxin-responsive promoter family protein [Nitrososphaerales archaeon]